jgi:hypothetical protein
MLKLFHSGHLLEITLKAYLDAHRIWKNDIYPVRVNVHPIYILEATHGIPIYELKEEVEMFMLSPVFKHSSHPFEPASIFYFYHIPVGTCHRVPFKLTFSFPPRK